MSRDQNAGQNHNIKIDYKPVDSVDHFKYLRTTITNTYCILEEIKSRLGSGNACYHSVQNILSSSLLSKIWRLKYTELLLWQIRPTDAYTNCKFILL
jgi:hypothetical protein